jgi:O-antigen ligase
MISTFTFYIWVNQLDMIGVLVLSSIAFLVLAFKKNAIHAMPFLLNMLFIISRLDWGLETLPLYLLAIPILTISGFVIHLIRFHEKWVYGHLTFPLILLLIGMILTVINHGVVDFYYFIYIALGLLYFIFYLLFLQTIKGNQLEYLIKLFFVLGILVSAEVLYHYISSGDIAASLLADRVHLGWGLSNYVATYLLIFIPASVYFIKMKPLKFLTAIVIAFEIMMLLFTLSRGGVLAFIVMVPFMIIYIYHGQRSKFRVTMYLLMIMISLAVVFALRTDYFQPLFDRFKELDFAEGNGRVDLWIQAYHKFKEHPLLGAGLLARFEEGRYHFYHNTIMHTLASFGIIGLASLVWQLIEVVIMFVKKANVQKSVLFLAIMAANIHGMVDNVYYQLQFMALFFVIISVVEAYNREKEYTSRFWRLENASTYEI